MAMANELVHVSYPIQQDPTPWPSFSCHSKHVINQWVWYLKQSRLGQDRDLPVVKLPLKEIILKKILVITKWSIKHHAHNNCKLFTIGLRILYQVICYHHNSGFLLISDNLNSDLYLKLNSVMCINQISGEIKT